MDEERIKTGFRDLDSLIGGFQKGELVLFGARPAMGKTAFARQLSDNVASSQEGIVLQFSAGGLGKCFWLKTLVSDIRCLAEGKNIRLIIIDDLQSIKTRRLKRKGSLRYVLKALKQLARELDCPIFVPANVSRRCEKRKDHRPQITDIAGYNGAGRIADTVLMLYRDRYYNMDSEAGKTAEVIVLKHKGVKPQTVYLTWDYWKGKFSDVPEKIRDPEASAKNMK